jgi:uncharacterized membrane protein
VPPLCAACILFAHGQVHLALGALLLTFLNMVAIQFASSLVSVAERIPSPLAHGG